jgi:hypothetical protein
MKTKILIIITLFGLFLSCEKPIYKADLEGTWYCENCEENYTFSFQNDTIYWSGKFDFVQKGIYHIADNHLQMITSKNDTIEFPITHFQTAIDSFSNDSLVLDTMIFTGKLNEQLYSSKFNLIDLDTDIFEQLVFNSIVCDEKQNYFEALFYNGKDILLQLSRENYIIHSESIDWTFGVQCRNARAACVSPIIFLDNSITANDYKKLHYQFIQSTGKRLTLVTKVENLNDYHYFNNYFQYWQKDYLKWLEENIEYTHEIPPPPLPILEGQKEYYYNNYLKIIIGSATDLERLNQIKKEQKVLISYTADLDMKTYIQAQIILKPLFKTGNIRTEVLGKVK